MKKLALLYDRIITASFIHKLGLLDDRPACEAVQALTAQATHSFLRHLTALILSVEFGSPDAAFRFLAA